MSEGVWRVFTEQEAIVRTGQQKFFTSKDQRGIAQCLRLLATQPFS